jgi:hypothetical protein
LNESVAKIRLAELGVNPLINLEEAIGLLQRSRKEGLIEGSSGYARCILNEGLSRLILGRNGVNSVINFEARAILIKGKTYTARARWS